MNLSNKILKNNILKNNVAEDFAASGSLAQGIKGFKPRESQRQMAVAVMDAINGRQQLVVEAGTGTGKTFAYLVPALRAGGKVIISTGSKALQDQLFFKDLPAVAHALHWQGLLALLKGRSNYLCLERFERHARAGGELTADPMADLVHLRSWSSQTLDGDISTCALVAEKSPLWPAVTSTNDNCLGSQCPKYQDCFVVKARRRAMNAEVLVVNHHLFLADCVLKSSGFAELIPHADVTIFDEAHQIPDIACQHFGQQLSSHQLMDLARVISVAYRTEVRDAAQLQKAADRLCHCTQDLRQVLGEPGFRGNLRDSLVRPAVARALLLLDDTLELCAEVITLSLGRSAMLDAALERTLLYRALLTRLREIATPDYSYWYECHARHFLLALTPLRIADRFGALLAEKPGCWLFTSATLSVNDRLDHFTQRLGLNAQTVLLHSPFDYARQALLCVPRNLPAPHQPDTAGKLAKLLQPLIEASRGRCFLLCTSHQMMRSLAAEFRASLKLPVLLQGESSKGKLLAQFIAAGDALLVATSSFWEGIDVRGEVLSCVIIDKLPFTSPQDPLLKARIAECRRRGGDPFDEIQLPQAVVTLKQGIGRLIRDDTDRGVLVICDNRLVMRSYGAVFLHSLPPAARTRDLAKAIAFLESSPH